ncbi:MAG: HEAT repeat domain-containing protein [Planctomycetes bacterium]|nr:HEAT repeat domain-containing protein [Planctomycetota bacterium]
MGFFGSRHHRFRSASKWAADLWSDDRATVGKARDAYRAMGVAASQDLSACIQSASHVPRHADALRAVLRERFNDLRGQFPSLLARPQLDDDLRMLLMEVGAEADPPLDLAVLLESGTRTAGGRAVALLWRVATLCDGIPHMLQALENPAQRELCHQVLESHRFDSVAELLWLVQHRDAQMRTFAARYLGNCADPQAPSILVQLVDDRDSQVRRAALQSIARCGWLPPEGFDKVKRMVTDPHLGEDAARCLGAAGPERLGELWAFQESVSGTVLQSLQAAMADVAGRASWLPLLLAASKDPAGNDALASILQQGGQTHLQAAALWKLRMDLDQDGRRCLAVQLGKFSTVVLVHGIFGLTDDAIAALKKGHQWPLAKAKSAEAYAELTRWLDDSDSDIQACASRILAVLNTRPPAEKQESPEVSYCCARCGAPATPVAPSRVKVLLGTPETLADRLFRCTTCGRPVCGSCCSRRGNSVLECPFCLRETLGCFDGELSQEQTSQLKQDERLATMAMRAAAALNSNNCRAQEGARAKLAQIRAQLEDDPERLARVTALANRMSGGYFSWDG